MMARPSKYTPATVKKIVDALGAGNTRRAACAYGGVDEKTLANWMRRYSDFSDAVKEAEASAEVGHVARIAQAAASGTWTASAWWLERRRPDDWGRKDKLDITATIRRLVRDAGLGEEAEAEALAEAEHFLTELRGGAGR